MLEDNHDLNEAVEVPEMDEAKVYSVEKIVPVPDDVSSPFKNGSGTIYKPKDDKFVTYKPQHIWEWCGADGSRIGYLIRLDFTDKVSGDRVKMLLQVLYCETKNQGKQWCVTSYGKNRPLFDLTSLSRYPSSPIVFMVEGELTAKRLEEVMQMPVVTCVGGANSYKNSDFSAIKGKRLVVIPDNDNAGKKYANEVRRRLIDNGNKAVVIDLSEGKPEKWDIGDDIKDGIASKEDIINRIEHKVPGLFNIEPDKSSILALGVDGDVYHYMTYPQCQVRNISNHSKDKLLSLAPLEHYELLSPNLGRSRESVDWTKVASDLMFACRRKGIFNSKRKRGLGCWIDEGRVVYHAGDRLYVDGNAVDIIRFMRNSKYIYEARHHKIAPSLEALSDNEGQLIIDVANTMPWKHPSHGIFLAGFIALAPVGASLNWRSHICLSGPPGSGKSTAIQEFMKPLLGEAKVEAIGGTSEAGLRQQLGGDALPVLFDESEQQGKHGKKTMREVLMLARVSSQNVGSIYKGTTSQDGQEFLAYSMFMLASTTVPLEHQADRSRFVVLELCKLEEECDLHVMQEKLAQIDSSLAPKLLARSLSNINSINTNAKTLSRIIHVKYCDKRLGDLAGYLLAGYYSLTHSNLLDDEQAIEVVNAIDLTPLLEIKETSQEKSTLQTILQHRLRCTKDGSMKELSIGQMLAEIVDAYGKHEFQEELMSYGLKYIQKNGTFAVALNSEALKKVFESTSIPVNYSKILERLEGSKVTAVGFGPGLGTAKGVQIPISHCYKKAEYDEDESLTDKDPRIMDLDDFD